ncbi:MAG: WecB/TagA/CpsF family glycosyltransferase [Candidatus Cloacimonetes bacterium]|nr:WecB/TagA/CpsF family glycosyltransferase [Candidatus Cloacimonadota bacterium]MDD3281889.1 WecB/TagA/CpsF family glycosyltransferase [Candidatus Cloacimonadota bacterium]MDD4231910.1 WecB/TagA/CpsF family glycosyltransferase [Candidatus Cloacimonadota bacterium]
MPSIQDYLRILIDYILETITEVILYAIVAASDLFIGLPIRLCSNKLHCFEQTDHIILGKNLVPISIKYIKSRHWFVQNAFVFPLILARKLRLVGVSLRYQDHNTNIYPPALTQTPGLLSLYFIRKSSRLAFTTAFECDLEYLHKKHGGYDLVLLLQSLVALIYHHDQNMITSYINIFDVSIMNISMSEAIGIIDKSIEHNKKSPIYFVNADCLNKVFIDKDYHHVLCNNDIVFPDGSGINLAAKILGTTLKENVNGTDMLPYLCALAQIKQYRIYLLGAASGVAEKMREKLEKEYPDLKICGCHHGFFDWDIELDEVIRNINLAHTDILLVAFGAPRQEFFIAKYGEQIDAAVQMGVGGLFDFYSERIARAPLWMRQIGMEWVFRLIMEPKRMWKRYLIGNPLFLYRVYRWKKTKLEW